MKRHQFFFEFLPNTLLCGVSISHYETKLEENEEWCPTISLAIGLIFFTVSYTNIRKKLIKNH